MVSTVEAGAVVDGGLFTGGGEAVVGDDAATCVGGRRGNAAFGVGAVTSGGEIGRAHV